jgi:hypothetical protein
VHLLLLYVPYILEKYHRSFVLCPSVEEKNIYFKKLFQVRTGIQIKKYGTESETSCVDS